MKEKIATTATWKNIEKNQSIQPQNITFNQIVTLTPTENDQLKIEITEITKNRAALATPDEQSLTRYSPTYKHSRISKIHMDRFNEAIEYLQIIAIVNDIINKPITLKHALTIKHRQENTPGLEADVELEATKNTQNHFIEIVDQIKDYLLKKVQLTTEKAKTTSFILSTTKIDTTKEGWQAMNIKDPTLIAQVKIPYLYYKTQK